MAKLTTYFTDLMFYLLPKGQRRFTVLLPNATRPQRATNGEPLPIHCPLVAFSPVDGRSPLKTAPWLLDGEELRVHYEKPTTRSFRVATPFPKCVAPLKRVLKVSKIELDTDCAAQKPVRGLLSARVSGLHVGALSVAQLSRKRTPVFKALTGHTGEVKGVTDPRFAVVVKHELEADRIVVERVSFEANRPSRKIVIGGASEAEMMVANGLEGPPATRNRDVDFEWYYNLLGERPAADVRRIPFYTTHAPVMGGSDCLSCCD